MLWIFRFPHLTLKTQTPNDIIHLNPKLQMLLQTLGYISSHLVQANSKSTHGFFTSFLHIIYNAHKVFFFYKTFTRKLHKTFFFHYDKDFKRNLVFQLVQKSISTSYNGHHAKLFNLTLLIYVKFNQFQVPRKLHKINEWILQSSFITNILELHNGVSNAKIYY